MEKIGIRTAHLNAINEWENDKTLIAWNYNGCDFFLGYFNISKSDTPKILCMHRMVCVCVCAGIFCPVVQRWT